MLRKTVSSDAIMQKTMKKLLILSMLTANLCAADIAQTRDAEEIVTLTLLGEARCQSEEGMRAIGQVILNRSRERQLPVDAICLQRLQFSCWNNKEAMMRRSGAMKAECEQATRLAESIAAFICNGMDVHETRADHYYAYKLCSPSWAKHGKNKEKIGDHLFLEL